MFFVVVLLPLLLLLDRVYQSFSSSHRNQPISRRWKRFPNWTDEFLAGILNTRNPFHLTGAEEIIVCEHGPSKGIRCEKGGKIIVLSANYGRLNIYTCPFAKIGNVTDCRAANSLDKVREMCQNQPSCTLTASNAFFHGDPCPSIQKYLLVEYYCFYY